MANTPADHIVMTETTARDPLAAHARNIRLRSLIVQVGIGAVLATVVFVRLDSAPQFLILAAGVAVVGSVVALISRRLGRDDFAKASRWAKVFATVSIEQDGTRRAYSPASVVMGDEGLVVRRRTSSRFAAATYATVIDVPWSDLQQIQYSRGRVGSWYPVISGPSSKIAAAGSVGDSFSRAALGLGASVS